MGDLDSGTIALLLFFAIWGGLGLLSFIVGLFQFKEERKHPFHH